MSPSGVRQPTRVGEFVRSGSRWVSHGLQRGDQFTGPMSASIALRMMSRRPPPAFGAQRVLEGSDSVLSRLAHLARPLASHRLTAVPRGRCVRPDRATRLVGFYAGPVHSRARAERHRRSRDVPTAVSHLKERFKATRTLASLRSSQSGTGSPLDRKNSALKSFDWYRVP